MNSSDNTTINPWLRIFLPFAAGYFLSYLLRNVNAVIAPELIRDLGVSAADLGLLTSAYMFAFGAFQLPLGIVGVAIGGVLLNGPLRARLSNETIVRSGCLAFALGVVVLATSRMPTGVTCIFAPLDLCPFVDRALAKVKPSVYVCLETELWPNMIRQAYRHGAKLLLLNGRISKRSFRGYRLIKGLIDEVLSYFVRIAVIQGSDAKRFRTLGAGPSQIRILGNAKYDQASLQSRDGCREHRARIAPIGPRRHPQFGRHC